MVSQYYLERALESPYRDYQRDTHQMTDEIIMLSRISIREIIVAAVFRLKRMVIQSTVLFIKKYLLQLLDESMVLLRAGYGEATAYELVGVEHFRDIRVRQYVICERVALVVLLDRHVRDELVNFVYESLKIHHVCMQCKFHHFMQLTVVMQE